MTQNIKDRIKTLPEFAGLADPVLDTLAGFCAIRLVRAGETIFCQGEPSPYFFVVLAGEVAIERVSTDRRFPKKILGIVGPGELFGESSIFEESSRVAMASASLDGELLVIRGPDFRQWLKAHPEMSHPLVLSLLKTTLVRLHRTNHELSVIYGIGRILGSQKPFPEQLTATMDFLKSSLEGLDDIVFYQRSAYWEEFEALQSLPVRHDLAAIPLGHFLLSKVAASPDPWWFEPQQVLTELKDLQLGWENRVAGVVVPLFEYEKSAPVLHGLILMASSKVKSAFTAERRLLLMSLALPLSEVLSRNVRAQDHLAQSRLQHSKQSFQ